MEENFEALADVEMEEEDLVEGLKAEAEEAGCGEVMRQIQQLKHGDLSKRVDSLVSLNELIT